MVTIIKNRLMIFVLGVALTGCASVPITGRKQLSLVPVSQLEMLSSQSYGQLINKTGLSNDEKKNSLLQKVGKRIAFSAEEFMRQNGMQEYIRNYDWEFSLIEDDKKINAFAMAGGKVGVYTGILSITGTEAGLATVLSHEIAHVIANHAGERMSQLLLANLGNVVLSQALRDKPDKTRQLTMLAYGASANIGVLLPFSRTHEREADRIGLILMAQAGYNPEAALGFWGRMNQKSGNRPLEFLSTHPDPKKRIESIKAYLPEAMSYYK